MIVFKVRSEDAFEMSLIEHDDVTEALAPDRTDHPFGVRILPRRTPGAHAFFDAHVRNAGLKRLTVDSIAIAIANQESWRFVLGEGFHHLSSGPFGRRMLRNIEMDHATTIVAQNYECEQDPKCRRGHRQKVDAHDILQVIIQERAPGL